MRRNGWVGGVVLLVVGAACARQNDGAVEARVGGLTAADYTMVDVGTLGGNESYVVTLNDHGQVLGGSTTSNGATHCFIWQEGQMTDLGHLGGDECVPTDMNESGQAVGYSRLPTGERRAFLYDHGVMTNLGTLGTGPSHAFRINDHGQVVGDVDDNRCFLYDGGVMTDLGDLGRGRCIPRGINNAGQIVGEAGVVGPNGATLNHPFIYQNGVMADLGTLPGPGYADATDINEAGQVVGSSSVGDGSGSHAYLYDAGVMLDLGTLGGLLSFGNSVDDAGHVFVLSSLPGDDRNLIQVVWESGALRDLRPFEPLAGNANGEIVGQLGNHAAVRSGGVTVDLGAAGFNLSSANAINDAGTVAGQAYFQNPATGDYEHHVTLWIKASAPPPSVTRQWIQLAPTGGPPSPREGHAAAYDPASNRMIVVGGINTDAVPSGIDVWALENANGLGGAPRWSQLGQWAEGAGPGSRSNFGAAYDASNDILMVYGGAQCSASPCPGGTDSWVLENASGKTTAPTWTRLEPTGESPGPLLGMAAVYDGRTNRLIIHAGSYGPGQFPNKVWVLTNANGRGGAPAWSELAPSGGPPTNRLFQVGVYDSSNDRLIIYGGLPFGLGTLNDIWALENASGTGPGPTRWAGVATGGLPPQGGASAAGIFDQAGRRFIVFGGAAGAAGRTNETWSLAGGMWARLESVGPKPPARYIHSAVYDPTSGRLIVFGGRTNSGDTNDVWVLPTVDGPPAPGAPDGQTCTGGGQCASTFCADGVCCASACGGGAADCQACSVAAGASADGTCGPRLGALCYARADLCDSIEPALTCSPAGVCPAPTPWSAQACGATSFSPALNESYADLLGGLSAPGGVRLEFMGPRWDGKVSAVEGFGCPPPTGFEFLKSALSGLGRYVNVDTQPPMGYPPIKICIHYPQSWISELGGSEGSSIERNVLLVHGTNDPGAGGGCNPAGAGWVNVRTGAVDTANNIVCGSTTSLSPFALVVPLPSALPRVTVPGNLVVGATKGTGAVVSYAVKATNAQGGALTPTCSTPSGATFPPGTTPVTCSATDGNGLVTAASFNVTVRFEAPADGSFFLLPLRANGSSIFRVGRPVPVRFRLTGASAGITNLVAKLSVTKLSSTVQGTAEDASDETEDDTDFLFKYRPLLKVYAYRWRTRDQTQGTYQLRADLGDGVTHQIKVSLKAAK